MSRTRPRPLRSSGRSATPRAIAARGEPSVTGSPPIRISPATGPRAHPKSVERSAVRPDPIAPATPTTSPSRTVSDTPASASRSPSSAPGRPTRRSRTSSAGSRGRCGAAAAGGGLTPAACPTMRAITSPGVVSAVTRVPAVRPSRSTVIRSQNREHLVHAVGDVDDRRPAGPERPQPREQPFGLPARQRGGRLVEHQHAPAAREGAHDLHDLPEPDAEIAHPRARRRSPRRSRTAPAWRAPLPPRRRDRRGRAATARGRARGSPRRRAPAPASAPGAPWRRRRAARPPCRGSAAPPRPRAPRRRSCRTGTRRRGP